MSEFSAVAAAMPDPFFLLFRESVSSTNDLCKDLARNRSRSGLVVLANEQTAGRGRRGKSWFTSGADSLAFSVLLKKSDVASGEETVALLAALAIADALAELGFEPKIKWPNDVMLAGQKIAGILVEAEKDFLILGIGININATVFPEGIEATSLKIISGQAFNRAFVFGQIIDQLSRVRLLKTQDIIGHYLHYDVLKDRQITLTEAEINRTGIVKGYGEKGELLLETSHGDIRPIIQATDIRIVS